jgi:hypothetical protein
MVVIVSAYESHCQSLRHEEHPGEARGSTALGDQCTPAAVSPQVPASILDVRWYGATQQVKPVMLAAAYVFCFACTCDEPQVTHMKCLACPAGELRK